MRKFFNLMFKFVIIYLVVNWIADNPRMINSVRNGLNGIVNKGISVVK